MQNCSEGQILFGTRHALSEIPERNFVPKKFRGIDSEQFPLFRGRKHSFRGIPSSAVEPIPKLRTERNGMEFRGKN